MQMDGGVRYWCGQKMRPFVPPGYRERAPPLREGNQFRGTHTGKDKFNAFYAEVKKGND